MMRVFLVIGSAANTPYPCSFERFRVSRGRCRAPYASGTVPGRLGGIEEAAALHDLCRDTGVDAWVGGMLETGIGRSHNIALSSLPNFSLPGDVSASSRYWSQDIIEPAVTVNPKGEIVVPTAAGRGFEVQRDRIEALTVRRQTLFAKARVTA